MTTPTGVGAGMTALSSLAPPELTRHGAETNAAYTAAEAAYRQAAHGLGDLLTEQITRRVLIEIPTAVTLRVVPVVSTFETHTFGQAVEGLFIQVVLDGSGAVAGVLALLSPVHYLLERLSELMDMTPHDLDLPSRAWSGGSAAPLTSR